MTLPRFASWLFLLCAGLYALIWIGVGISNKIARFDKEEAEREHWKKQLYGEKYKPSKEATVVQKILWRTAVYR
jgi:hypothetical protein